MDAVQALLELYRDPRCSIDAITFQEGSHRFVFRAEADEDVHVVLQERGFNYARSAGQSEPASLPIIFTASLEEVRLSAERKNCGKHFFICELPTEYEEVQLEVHRPEQHMQSAACDTLFNTGRTAAGHGRLYFAKAGLSGRHWSPRTLLFVRVRTD